MTPEQEAKFEAWAKSCGLNLYRYDGQFTDRATQYALTGWKACLAQRESCGKTDMQALRETAQKLRHMLVRLHDLLDFDSEIDDTGITFHDPYKVNAAFADAARLLDDTAALTDKQETQ